MSNLGGKVMSENTDADTIPTGVVETVVAGTNITSIDSTDPKNPIINAATQAAGTIPSGHVRRDTDLPIVTTTDIVWQTESYDDDDFIDIGSDPTHITVPTGVTRVNISCNVKYANTVTVGTNYILEIRQFNSSDALIERVAGQNGQWGTTAPQVSACALGVPVTATDYFEIRVFNSDTTVTIDHAQATIQDVS